MIVRALLGALVAGTVAGAARRAESLSASGQWAAFVVGTLVATAGWRWAALLIAYFVLSSLLTRAGLARKAARAESALPDQHARSAVQVLVNGGLFTALVLVGEFRPMPVLQVGALGALAAATADTWATEIGLLWGGTPRSVVTWRAVAPGLSGGVTFVGLLASITGASLVALGAVVLFTETAATEWAYTKAVAVGGVAGSLADSLLGATLQSRRWCEQCRAWTERRVHTCQYRTQHARGLRWMTNDTVNFVATVVGALVALVLTVAAG